MKRRLAVTILMVAALAASLSAGDLPAGRPGSQEERALVTPLVLQAREALFERSQLEVARQLAQQQLRQYTADVEAVFIEMEAAALQADTAAELNAALKLCELRSAQRDPRVAIGAARLLSLAANTEEFRAAIPRIQAILAHAGEPHAYASYLRAALVAAAADGAPAINMAKVARESGLMTEWRVAGAFGRYANLEFDQHWAPERDALLQPSSDGHPVERLHFDDGFFRLPAYFARHGVFYAAADVAAGGLRNLRVESPGTLEVMVDGAVVLRKDDRFRATPEIAWRTVHLRPGTHRVVVKFLASAVPFRVALVPALPASLPKRSKKIDYAPEAAYVAAATKYWAGDYNGVITSLGSAKNNGSAAVYFLVYQAWRHVDDDSPESPALLNATLAAAPTATAAEYELARRAYSADRIDEALQRLQRVIKARERFAPGQELMAQIAIGLNWPVLAEKALETPLRVHPSCDILLSSYKFFLGHARYERAREMQKRLADCAPDTLASVHILSGAGEHDAAAAAAEAVVARRPLDRSAREALVRELAMAGHSEQAHKAAEQLSELAPNSDLYRRMAGVPAANLNVLFDEVTPRSADFGRREAFYSSYRRDGLQMVSKTADRNFSGGPAVTLLDDRIARVWDDGSTSLYVHKLTRVLDRDGIEKYGEVEYPRGAEVLELRTIKTDGSVAEPEITPQKVTVSMPALAAGDAIDLEYVVSYGDGIAGHAKLFQHTFGSFAAPVLYSRFVEITPAREDAVRAEVSPGILPARVDFADNTRVRTWEKDDIPQSVEEVATARGDVLPIVRLQPDVPGGWNDIRERFRNDLVDALRIGPRVEQMASQLRSRDPQAKAREIYRTVANSIRPASAFNPEDMPAAEETLAEHSGSRTIAVLAVARAAGLDADLVLARNTGEIVRESRASFSLYARPLIKFRFADGHDIFADAETEGLAFGTIPPTVERHDALLIPAMHESDTDQPAAASALIALPANAEDQSVADGDVTLDRDGSLRADVTIRMGAWRGAQMRSILAGIEPEQRPRFFQQLASRIFAGAEQVTGTARNEHDPDRPLKLILHCRAARYINLAQNAADLDQLVPPLGLKKMYPGTRRNFPLFIDTPLVESSNFRVHLPAGLTVQRTPNLSMTAAFGSYSLTLRQHSPNMLDIQRSFCIPVQVVAPERFKEFSTFASRIDDVERQRILLNRN